MMSGDGFFGVFRPALSESPACLEIASPPESDLQPVSMHADGVSVACHGEMYNHHELCVALDLASGTPLPQLLAAGWRKWALDLLPRLDGVFALLVCNANELLLYRDPSGLRNLYFHAEQDDRIAFATSLRDLVSLPRTKPGLARHSLHEYLRFLEVAPPNTLFQGVTAVEAGWMVRWTPRGMQAGMAVSPSAGSPSPLSFEAAVDALDTHLQRSVQTHLEGASRPAAFLSGGIDSALLCAIAVRQRSKITAVTVGFDGAAYDESPVAQRIATHLGIAHHVLRFDHEQCLRAFERLSQQTDQPLADPAAMVTLLAFDHCSNQFDVVLDGTGADEAVGMMPPRHVRLAVAWASRIPPGLRNALARWLRAVPGASGYAPIVDFDHPADTMARWRGFKRPQIEWLCGESVSLEHTQFHKTYERYAPQAHFERYSALLNAMTSDRLNQALMLSHAPVRFPFCEAETDRFIRQLRTEYRYLPGQPKRTLRALLARYVPPEIWDTPKHGFNFPLREFIAGQDFMLVRQHLDAKRWQGLGMLPPNKVQDIARQFIAGDDRLTFQVWALVALAAWVSAHNKSPKRA